MKLLIDVVLLELLTLFSVEHEEKLGASSISPVMQKRRNEKQEAHTKYRLSMAAYMNVHELISVCMIWFSVHKLDIITNYIRPSVMPQVFSSKQMHYWSDG